MKSSIKIPKNIFYKSYFLEYSCNLSDSILFLSSYNYQKEKEISIILRVLILSSIVWILTYPIDSYKKFIIISK
jgi:hypothetical protein